MYISDVQEQVSNLTAVTFSAYTNLSGKEPLGDFSLAQWLERISNNPRKEEILAIRALNLPKEELNKKKFPFIIVTPHAQIKGERLNNNLIALTGLLFIDVDGDIDPDACKELLIACPEVIAVWKSFSGKGVHGIAQVNNLPTDSIKFRQAHKTYFAELSNRTGLVFDDNVCKLTHSMLESYDSAPFIKSSWNSYDLVMPAETGQGIIREEEDKINTMSGFRDLVLRTKMTLESYPEEIVSIPEGRCFYECYIPGSPGNKIITPGRRNVVLSTYTNNLILLNPWADLKIIISKMLIVNRFHCKPNLPDHEVITIVKNKWRDRTSLKPIGFRMKKIWIDPKAEDKLEKYYQWLRNRTTDKIAEFFEILPELAQKVTEQLISETCNVSSKTVSRYLKLYPEWKEIIETHNAQYINKRKINRTPKLKQN
jgi:hypothetical protein